MSKVSLSGNATGTATFDIVAPATNTNRVITLPDSSGQVSVLDLRTAVTASGTSVDFLNIPATARRVTVMFSGVSTNGTSPVQVQLGSGSVQTTGYTSTRFGVATSSAFSGQATTGLGVGGGGATTVATGIAMFVSAGNNTWNMACNLAESAGTSTVGSSSAGSVTLSGTLDRIRITTVNGTDTFDAGTINIMVE